MPLETSCPGEISAASLPPAVALIRAAAAELGLTVKVLDPEFGHLFELTDGRRGKILLGGRSPLNDAVAARLAEDKYYTGLLLGRAGFRVPRSRRCLKPGFLASEPEVDCSGLPEAVAFAETLGYPLVVKPNRLSHGRHVAVVTSAIELEAAIRRVWEFDYLALVQTAHAGIDVRLDFLDGEFLLGYTRRRGPDSPRTRLGIDILNLARGAQADVLESVRADWSDCGRRIGEVLNLRYYGIDFKVPDLATGPEAATVLEVNASPLFVQIHRLGHTEPAHRAQVRTLAAIWNPR